MSVQLFEGSAMAELLLDPEMDRLLDASSEARRLLQVDAGALGELRPSVLFNGCFPELVVFSQELMECGRGWTERLLLQVGDSRIATEITGASLQHEGRLLLHFCIHVSTELDSWRSRADAHRHYLSGITHWTHMGRVFQEFERENRLLLDAAGEGIYGVDANGLTTFVNPAAERILGYTAEEMAGRNMHRMVHHSRADGRHYHEKDCPIFAAFRDGEVHRVEDEVFWSRSGEPIDVEYVSTPVRDNGQIVGTVVIFRDVSQKKADQRRLQVAMEEVQQLKNRLELENAYLQEEINSSFDHQQIVGSSAPVQKLLSQIALVGPTDATVLVVGESGTGKELVARALHDSSERSERSLIRVNCAAIPADLFESEFFGHVKGAFTGAVRDRAGRFELADGGTLFLDEVGEIPLQLQGKLLRVLQEQQFERVGEAHTRQVDVRIIAATNRDLAQLVKEGRFREDLYFRLNVFPLESVPLRKRKDDIPILTQHFLNRVSKRFNKRGLRIPAAEMERLRAYDWPGNIRELENVVERQVILAQGSVVTFDDSRLQPQAAESPVRRQALATDEQLRQLQRQNIEAALGRCGGKVSGVGGAAEVLGVAPTTLASRIRKFNIDPRQYRPVARGGK